MAAGSIVVVAKCPIPGKTKTRLIPLLTEDGAARLSKAMLSDVLSSISSYVRVPEGQAERHGLLTETILLSFRNPSRKSTRFFFMHLGTTTDCSR